MKRPAFRFFITLFFSFLFLTTQASDVYDREIVQPRLEAMECIVKPRFNTSVENYIKGYFARDAYKTKLVLARTVTYFPIFEEYLTKHNMPDDLKYLAIVESALNPKAVSRVGATGLWQFMKETGIGHGLKINSRVDERSCPTRSTIAALEYLAKAHERFGSWELAIASYNCGAGNVIRAMKRAGGSDDYWEISPYLPRETRNFVPAFIGAAYMVKHHHLHDVTPEYNNLDQQLIQRELVFSKISFETIAAVAGLPLEVVKVLNPAFKRGYVPANVNGHWVALPSRSMQALLDYIQLLRPDNGTTSELPELPELIDIADYNPADHYYKTNYTILKGDRLDMLGELFNCAPYHLKAWNGLFSDQLKRGQKLVVWFPKEIKRYQPFHEKVEVLPVAPYISKKEEIVRRQFPNIEPLATIQLAPFNGQKERVDLPFTALSVTEAELRLAIEQKIKLTPPQKVKSWVIRMPIFNKKNSKTD